MSRNIQETKYKRLKRLNTISKDHLCVIFNMIKYIVSTYLIISQNIGFNKCFYVIYKKNVTFKITN